VKSRFLSLIIEDQRVDMVGEVARRLWWSLVDSQFDLTRKTEIFSKVGSLRKEWEAEIRPKDPGAVASLTDVG